MHEQGVVYGCANFGACVKVIRSKDNSSFKTKVHLSDLSNARLINGEEGQEVHKARDFDVFERWRRSREVGLSC
jgi:hypothetical protein